MKVLKNIGSFFRRFFIGCGKFFKKAGMFCWRFLCGTGRFFKKLWQHKQGRVGLIIVAFLAVLAIFAPLIAPYDPYDVTQRAEKGLTPSWEHLLGTSITTGQDIFSMLIYGTRSSLSIGLITGVVIAVLGSLLGIAAGYLGGWVDTLIMRVVDVLLVIPSLPLVIVMTNVLGTSYAVIVLVFAAFGWTGLARVVRSQVILIKNANYVKAAELVGASKWYIMWRHILPAVSNLLIIEHGAHQRGHHGRGGGAFLPGAGQSHRHQLGQNARGRPERRRHALRALVEHSRARYRHLPFCVFLYAHRSGARRDLKPQNAQGQQYGEGVQAPQ